MYSLYVISNKAHLFEPIVKSLSPERVSYFDGTGYPSFSKLVNSCVARCPTETIIIMSDKVLPTSEDVKKTISLLEQGFAFVALYRFAFFGFKKELMRRIGMMDENYIGGGYEDEDFYMRLIERNLSMYVTHEVKYVAGDSGWKYEKARDYHFQKWRYSWEESKLQRRLSDPKLNYNLGPSIATEFLSGDHSYVLPDQVAQFFKINIRS